MAQVEFIAVFLMLFRRYRLEVVKLEGETDEEVNQRLDGMMRNSISKLTLEMNVYGMSEEDRGKEREGRGIGLRWIKREISV